jgi:hypothetical protein
MAYHSLYFGGAELIRLIFCLMLLSTHAIAQENKMNPMAELAVKLQKAGYSQQLIKGDNVYLLKTNDYLQYIGLEIQDEYVKVPKIENLISNLRDQNYFVNHTYQGMQNGEIKEQYTVTDGDMISITNENIWVCMAKYWLVKKGG